MYIEVWNERFPEAPDDGSRTSESPPPRARPDKAEFLGQAHVFLELDADQPVKTLTLKLHDSPDGGLRNREVTGSVSIQYEWMPHKGDGWLVDRPVDEPPPRPSLNGKEDTPTLHG